MVRKEKSDKKTKVLERDNKEIKANENALKIRIPDGSPVEAEDLNNQGKNYYEQGKYAEAEPLYIRALLISEKSLGPENPELKTYLTNLAELYKAQGKYADAEPLYLRAVAILEKSLGSDHPNYSNLFELSSGIL